jgi:hypothetical protein
MNCDGWYNDCCWWHCAPVYVTSAAGVISANVWYYIELQMYIANAGGYVTLRVNGTTVASATGIDTQVLGSPSSPIARLFLRGGGTGVTVLFDDLYLTTGSSCGFQGDHVVGSCVTLREDAFNNLDAWTEIIGTPSIVTGRTGTGLLMEAGPSDPTTFESIFYTIPTVNESGVLTIGFAWKVTSDFERVICQFHAEGIVHVELATNAGGGFNIRRGTPAGNIIGSSPYGAWSINTWYYLEMQCQLKNVGFGRLRVNGSEVINVSDVDTRNGGTKLKFDRIAIGTTHSQNQTIDDLYLSSGEGCKFRGSVTPYEFYEPFNNTTAWT